MRIKETKKIHNQALERDSKRSDEGENQGHCPHFYTLLFFKNEAIQNDQIWIIIHLQKS